MDPVSSVTSRDHSSARAETGGNNRFIFDSDDGLDKIHWRGQHFDTEAEWKNFSKRAVIFIQGRQRVQSEIEESMESVILILAEVKGNLMFFYTELHQAPWGYQAEQTARMLDEYLQGQKCI